LYLRILIVEIIETLDLPMFDVPTDDEIWQMLRSLDPTINRDEL